MSGQFAKAGLLAIALLAGNAQAVAPEDAPTQAPAADRRAQAGAAGPAPQASAPPSPPRIASRYITPPATGQVPRVAIVRLAQLPAADRRTRAGAAGPALPVLMLPPPPPRTASRFLAPPATRGAPQAAVVRPAQAPAPDRRTRAGAAVPTPQVPAPPPPPRIASRYIAPPAARGAAQAPVARPAQAPAPDRRTQGDANAAVPAPQVPEARPAAPATPAPERPQTTPDKPQEAASPPPPRIASRYITPPATGQAPQATVVRLAQAPEPAAAAQTAAEPALAEQNTAAREAYRSASRAVGALVDRMRQAQAEVDRLRKGRDRQALRDARTRARAVRAELLQARAARDAAKRERDRVILLAAAAEQLKSADEIKALFASASGRAELASRSRQYPKVGEWNAVTVRNVTDAGMLVGVMEHAGFGVRYAQSGLAEDPHYAGLQSSARPLKGRWEGLVTGYYAGASDGSAKHIGTGNALLEFNMGLSSDEVAGLFVFEDGFPVREALLVFAPINGAGEFSGTDWDFLLVPRDVISHLANARFNPSGFNPGAIRPYFIPSTIRDDLTFEKHPLTTTWDRVRVNGRMKGAVFGPEREEIAGLLLATKFVNENLDGNLHAAFGAKETQPSVPTPEE